MNNKPTYFRNSISLAFAAFALVAVAPVFAHGDGPHSKNRDAEISTELHAFGKQGDRRKVTRTIHIDMSDQMRFSPAAIRVKQGETIRFIVRNKGKLPHEMVVGTLEELKEHGELMKKFPDMEHDEPYMAHVKPGDQQEMIWQFTHAGDFYFGCLMPGHFDAGMIGKITVKKG